MLWQTGELKEKAGKLTIPATGSFDNWPQNLAETLRQRANTTLARLDPSGFTRKVLRDAAVLGEAFDFELLMRYLTAAGFEPTALERSIEMLIDVNLLNEPEGLKSDRLHFCHTILCRVLKAEVERSDDYSRLCAAGAQAMVEHYGDRVSGYSDIVAPLFEASGDIARAAENWCAGAISARRDNYLKLARTRFERAEGLLAGLPGLQGEAARAEVWLELGTTELRLGDAQRARNLAAQVFQWGVQVKDPQRCGRALLLLGDSLRRSDRLEQAARSYGKAAVQFSSDGDRGGVVRALLGQAAIDRDRGHLDDALQHYVKCESILREVEDAEAQARLLRGKGEGLSEARRA